MYIVNLLPEFRPDVGIHFMSLKRRSYEVIVFLLEILNIEHICNIFRFIPNALYLEHQQGPCLRFSEHTSLQSTAAMRHHQAAAAVQPADE